MVDALQATFASGFIDPDFHDIQVSMEYPMQRQNMPSCWVNYEDQDSLVIAGIDHREYVLDDPTDPFSLQHEVTRWMFAGEVTLTFVALSSIERDRLYDQFVRVFAFSRMERASTDFRTLIETNPFIAVNINWDELRPHGDAAAPGTPWNTDNEVIYEKSIGFDLEGEFVSDPATNTLLPLSAVTVTVVNSDDLDANPFVLGVPRPSQP